jgi:hypothetical protein
MGQHTDIRYSLLLKPSGGLIVLVDDRAKPERFLIDIDMTPEELRSLAADLGALANQVENMPRALPDRTAPMSRRLLS